MNKEQNMKERSIKVKIKKDMGPWQNFNRYIGAIGSITVAQIEEIGKGKTFYT